MEGGLTESQGANPPPQLCPARMPVRRRVELGQEGRGSPQLAGHTHRTLPRSGPDAGRSTTSVRCRTSHMGPSHNAADPGHHSPLYSPETQDKEEEGPRRLRLGENPWVRGTANTQILPPNGSPHHSAEQETTSPERWRCCAPNMVS